MRVNVLGPVQVLGPDGELNPGPPKQRALLSLLVMHADQVLPADTIIDRLWGDHPPPSAHGSLQVYVSNLRKLLEPERRRESAPRVLVSAGPGYGLVGETLDVDARELERLVTRARELLAARRTAEAVAAYDAALALWRGDGYDDVATEEWAQPEVSRLAETRRTATEERAEALLVLGRASDAVASLEPFVARHPLRERAWELLVRAHVRLDHQAAALDCLRRVRALLDDELGIEPGPRLQALQVAVLRQEVPPDEPAPARAGTRFVGRSAELAALEDARHAAARGPVVVLVDGEPGVGKSALVTAFAGEATLWGRNPDHDTTPPLWPWEQVLRSLTRRRPGLPVPATVRELLDGKGQVGPEHDAEGARLRFFDAVVEVLAAAAPLEIVLEDLHASDTVSLRLLEHVAAAGVPGLLVVGTYRSHEAALLTATLARLSRAGTRRIGLTGLGTDDVRALVREVSGDDPGVVTAGTLHDRTAGNAFFVIELARSAGEVPDSVRDVVRHRVDLLGPEAAEVLDAAAVVGDRFEAWLVAEVSGTSAEATTRALDRAYDAGLVRDAGPGPGHQFSHALVVDALRTRHSPAWRAVRHERCARALTRTQAGRDDRLATIARHWLAASELGPDRAATAAGFCGRAATAALARHAPEEAIVLGEEALAAAELAGQPPEERFDLLLGLAHACYAAGRYDEGHRAARQALAAAGADPHRVVQVADAVMADSIWLPFAPGDDPSVLTTALDRALGAVTPGSPDAALGQSCRAVLLACTGREHLVDEASADAVAAARRLEPELGPDLTTRALHLRLIALRGPDFVAERADTARKLRSRPGVPDSLVLVADLHTASHHVEVGRPADAWSMLTALEDRAEALRDPALLRQTTYVHVALDLLASRYDEALARLDAVVARTSSVDRSFFQAAELGVRALVLFEQGRLVELLPVLEQAFALTALPGFGYTIGLAVAETDPDRARSLLRETPLPPRDYSWVTATMTRLHLAIALGERDEIRACRELFLPFTGGLLVNGTLTSVLGAYDGHLGEAALALGDVETARSELTSAVDLLTSAGAGYWLERTRQALAKCP